MPVLYTSIRTHTHTHPQTIWGEQTDGAKTGYCQLNRSTELYNPDLLPVERDVKLSQVVLQRGQAVLAGAPHVVPCLHRDLLALLDGLAVQLRHLLVDLQPMRHSFWWGLINRYRKAFSKCNVGGLRVVGCLLFVSFQPIHASQTEVESSLPNGHSLFLSSLSCLSLSLWSLTHTLLSQYIYTYMLHSNWEQFSFQPVLHGAHATQSHSFHPLTIHSSIRLQTHSHSTDHSLIPQAHAIIPLHKHSSPLVNSNVQSSCVEVVQTWLPSL